MSVVSFPGAEVHAALWGAIRAPRIAELPPAPAASPPREICIATPDIVGPVRNGGIGTACTAIARLWAAAGHRVTVLYVRGAFTESEPIEAAVAAYAAEGITLVPCPAAPHRLAMPAPLQVAYDAYHWLRTRRFDLIYIPEWSGCGHYVLAARRLGIGFRETRILVGTHSPTLWHFEGNQRLPRNLEPLCADGLERAAVAAADAVVSPSRYMLEWLGAAGWSLPARCHVLGNPMPAHARDAAAPPRSGGAVREIVFFGRLEVRKGLLLFLDAVNRLDPALRDGIAFTFLGKRGDAARDPLAAIASARVAGVAGWQVRVDLDTQAAGRYLAEGGRVAVIPSLVENSPMTVLECLGLGIPFLAAEVGGIPELLHPEDHARHLFRPTTPALAEALAQALRHGLPPARPAMAVSTVDRAWRDLAAAYAAPCPLPSPPQPARDAPRVSVVLVTRNRPRTLAQALDGLRAQTWPDLEVVLVDDGSENAEALAALDALEPEFARRGWRILRQSNRYLGAARNAGWRAATGDYVLFHDDDNISLPHLVETFLRAAEHAGADVVTGAMAVFSGEAPPPGGVEAATEIFAPIGGVYATGAYANLYGDAHALFRCDALERLGGFSEDFGVGHEDWELLARATLSGMTVLAVPEPLFWYRISPDSMLRTRRDPDGDLLRGGRPFLELLPPQIRPAMAYAFASKEAALTGTLQRVVAACLALARRPVLGLPLRAGWRVARPVLRRALEGTGR